MANNTVGFAVAQRVEYGKQLEADFNGRYAICKKAVDHFVPEFSQWVKTWRVGDPDADMELETKCRQLALDAQKWAQENHPWKNQTGQAERLLKGFLVIDGAYK
jgi:hypothetical protein